MGLLDILWQSYQGMQEERNNRRYDDDDDDNGWSPEYPERKQSSLPPRKALVDWKGYYRDFEGRTQWCSGVSAIVDIEMACRLCNNDRGITVQWLRQCVPGYCQPESDNSGAYARIIEVNESYY